MIFTKEILLPIGKMTLQERNDALIAASLQELPEGRKQDTPLLRLAEEQLLSYFAGERRAFDLPLCMQGTPFQMQVWQALREIPYGETRSYGDIARAIGNSRACRAVGMANNKNPLLIFVPCHRVIGADGGLTGFGAGLSVKEYLLRLEAGKLTSGGAK